MNLEINNRATLSTSKPLPASKLASVEAGLKQRKDGADSLGVQTADGQMQLILTQTAQKLSTTSQVRVNGQPAKVLFAENETNTAREGAFKAMGSKASALLIAGSGAALTLLSYAFSGGRFSAGDGIFRFVLGAVASSPVIFGVGALLGTGKGAVNKMDNQVSDRLLRD